MRLNKSLVSAIIFTCLSMMGYAQQFGTATNETVLLNNQRGWIPINNLDRRDIATISASDVALVPFRAMLDNYADIRHYDLPDANPGFLVLDEKLKFFNTLVFAVTQRDLANDFLPHFINSQSVGKRVIVVLIGSGRLLDRFDHIHVPILWSEGDDKQALENAAMSVFGGLACTNHLEQSFSVRYTRGSGFTTDRSRLTYAGPAAAGLDTQALEAAIGAIAEEAIRERATPGAVVMVVKNGDVIFQNAYGHHTYEKERPTRVDDIFDMASITKIAATTLVAMRLSEQGVIHLDSTMGHYLLQAQATNKADVTLREVMLHEAGFIPYIPFYRDLAADDLRRDSSATHSVKVADHAYIKTNYYENVMWPTMLESKRNAGGTYVYSDISMYVIKEVAEHQTGVPMQDYIQDEFYYSLGMKSAGYNPRARFGRDRIVPTEYDKDFRGVLLQGYVHDQGAAMAGGVAGHAGLFASANDLAIFGQLLLNRGSYGGRQYFKPETVDLFTSKQSLTSRRGLGFDRKDPDPSKEYPSVLSSDATYGHTGYTGTCIWIDPEEQLIYIFLSNRVHPEVSPMLGRLNIRGRIQDAVYEALKASRD